MAFATNCKVTRWALHGGDWRGSRGADETDQLLWAEANWGDDAVVAEVEALLHAHDSAPEPQAQPACAAASKDREVPEPPHVQQLAVNINGVTAPAMPCEIIGPIRHREKFMFDGFTERLVTTELSPP